LNEFQENGCYSSKRDALISPLGFCVGHQERVKQPEAMLAETRKIDHLNPRDVYLYHSMSQYI
jgi:hypothetical protein